MRNEPEENMQLTPEEKAWMKEWMHASAPGEERLAGVSVPLPRRSETRTPRRRVRPLLQHFATGAVLFIAGYFLGQTGHAGPGERDREITEAVVPASINTQSQTQTAEQREPVSVTEVPATTTQGVLPESAPEPGDSRAVAGAAKFTDKSSECKAPQFYQGKDGRFRVDAVLCETGSRATWVINPNLEIASIKKPESSEESHQ